MPKIVRYLIVLGAPVLVGVVNVFHPVHMQMTGAYQALAPHMPWWLVLHLINLVGFSLLGLAAFLLVNEQAGLAATLSRVCIAVYVPFYIGLDTLAGIGTGMLIQHGQTLFGDQLRPVEKAIDVLWAGRITYAFGAIGSIAWSLAMFCAAVAFTDRSRKIAVAVLSLFAFLAIGWGFSTSTFGTFPWWIAVVTIAALGLALGRPRGPSALLIVSGVLFGTLHVPPFGPLGMLCFLAAALWLEFGAQMHRSTAHPAVA
ncbi:MAG TPA: hypothetical protein VEN28_01370 [Burkholderiaceae bacterium]|nr:hypothetical protein [Burkholderiaceae bacterium]